jgi:hypothetical protein
MGDSESSAPDNWQKRRSNYQEKLLQLAVLGIPLGLLSKFNEYLIGRVVEQPRQVMWFLIPIGLAAWVLHRGVARGERFHLDRRVLAFLGAYVLLFSMAAQASFLDWSRNLTVFGRPAERSGLTPVSWGDWRYRFVPTGVPSDELVIVLIKPLSARGLEGTRKDLADVIALAANNNARGVALDVYFQDESRIDRLLCHVISKAGIPVYAGYGFEREQGHLSELPTPRSLRACLTPEKRFHLAGFVDMDGVCRLTPLYFQNNSDRPALGLAVAKSLSGSTQLDLPSDGLLRFVEPPNGHLAFRLQELQSRARARNLLQNRFLLVGEESESDTFETPFGRKLGVAIHADVVYSLRQSHFIRPHSWWLGLAVTLVFCYWLTVWCANGVSLRRLSLLCAGATVFVIVLAVVGIRSGPYWIEVVYPLAAIWLLLPLLIGVRRVWHSRKLPVQTAAH